jgi:hypothetical protein
VDVVLLGALRGQHEGLHEPPHRLAVVGEFAAHLGSIIVMIALNIILMTITIIMIIIVKTT